MTTSHQTRVYLTVDVECSEERIIGAALQPARGYDLRVWGRLANQGRELGLPLVTDALAEAGLVAPLAGLETAPISIWIPAHCNCRRHL